jgi:hypothetical protein
MLPGNMQIKRSSNVSKNASGSWQKNRKAFFPWKETTVRVSMDSPGLISNLPFRWSTFSNMVADLRLGKLDGLLVAWHL